MSDSITREERERMKQIIDGVTHASWSEDGEGRIISGSGATVARVFFGGDAAYIAAFNPTNVKRLLAALNAVEAQIAAFVDDAEALGMQRRLGRGRVTFTVSAEQWRDLKRTVYPNYELAPETGGDE